MPTKPGRTKRRLSGLQFFTNEGVRLSYVEDPLPREDLDGFARLNATTDIDIVGHDYIVDYRELRRFVERGAFSRLRVIADIDHAIACADIAREFRCAPHLRKFSV